MKDGALVLIVDLCMEEVFSYMQHCNSLDLERYHVLFVSA